MHLDAHRSLLNDHARTRALERAVAASVRPGDVVLDLGSGTGILALFACRAGAARVYAIDSGPVLEVAREVARDNGVEDRIRFLRGLSTGVELPERVDVVVAEILGSFALDEGVLGFLADARDRFLRTGGRTVPERVRVRTVPVEAPEVFAARIGFWADDLYGFDFGAVRRRVAQTPLLAESGPLRPMARPWTWLDRSLDGDEEGTDRDEPVRGEQTFRLDRSGTVHGLGVWFWSRLAEGVEIETGPDRAFDGWLPGLLPLEEPVEARAGSRVDVFLEAIPWGSTVMWNWELEVESVDGPRLFQASTGLSLGVPSGGPGVGPAAAGAEGARGGGR